MLQFFSATTTNTSSSGTPADSTKVRLEFSQHRRFIFYFGVGGILLGNNR